MDCTVRLCANVRDARNAVSKHRGKHKWTIWYCFSRKKKLFTFCNRSLLFEFIKTFCWANKSYNMYKANLALSYGISRNKQLGKYVIQIPLEWLALQAFPQRFAFAYISKITLQQDCSPKIAFSWWTLSHFNLLDVFTAFIRQNFICAGKPHSVSNIHT